MTAVIFVICIYVSIMFRFFDICHVDTYTAHFMLLLLLLLLNITQDA